jgi:vacuolar-type H+-ATPase subunit E/Vma4
MSQFKKYLGIVTEGKNSNPIKHYTEKNIEDNEPAFLNLINELQYTDINELQRVESIYELESENLKNIVEYFLSGREKIDHMSAESNFKKLQNFIINNYDKIKKSEKVQEIIQLYKNKNNK